MVSRRRALTTGILHEQKIINTLESLQMLGLSANTIKVISQKLNQLARNVNLTDAPAVLMYITGLPNANISKLKLCNCYEYFCKENGIPFQKPKFDCPETVPIIPTTANVQKIISASTRRYATIFTILAETGFEGEELHCLHRKNIDTEQGIISITGHKHHASGTYKLRTTTTEMLREYITKNPQDQPFPDPRSMAEEWRTIRNRLADNLKQPELKNIMLKSLRNYSGAQLYYKTIANGAGDPIAVMRHLRHKKLETTMHYIRGMILKTDEDYQYICKCTNIKEEVIKLIEDGFQKVDEIDGYKLYRKRK
jgi:integrase